MQCFHCNERVCSIPIYMIHLQRCADLHNLTYKCNIGNCNRIFGVKVSFKNHLNSHQKPVNPQIVNIDSNLPILQIEDPVEAPTIPMISDLDDSTIESYKLDVMKFALSLYGDVNISRKRAQEIIDSFCQLSVNLLRVLNSSLVEVCPDHKALKLISKMIDFFTKGIFTSEYKFLQALQKAGLLVLPEQLIVHIDEKEFYVHMIPLSEIFSKFFEKPGVLQLILDYISSFKENVVKNVMQTKFWLEKIQNLDQSSTLYLPLLIYFDDLEVLNALGSHSGMYKLGATYVQLACLPEHLQSKVMTIFLALLFFSDDRKRFGNERIFRPFINEINKLFEEGILVQHERYKKIKFVPILVIGDNLGLHQLLGFVEGFSASHYCRFCTLSNQDARSGTVPNENDLRTIDNYEVQLAMDDSRATGLKERCIFNDFQTYHVISNPSVDIMHDVQEGVLHYIMCKIILQFINEDEYFSLDLLNELILIFDYGPLNLNKPNLITMNMLINNKIRNSAAEMMNFCYYFPLIVGHVIDRDSPYWKLFIILRKVISTIYQKSYPVGTPDYAHSLIEELIRNYVECFGHSVPPKLHFLLHYKTVMSNVGPLTTISCNRFETKHQQFMKIGKQLHCRKNFTLSLAKKHQLMIADFLEHESLTEEIMHGHLTDLSENIDGSIGNCTVTSYLVVRGVTLKKKVVVQIDSYPDQIPVFGLIEQLIKNDEDKFQVYCQVLETVDFDNHYQAYAVEKLDRFILKPIENVCLHRISSICTNARNQKLVVWH
jgi:hypothetical protein